jgi:pre-mRNA-processing factor 6
MVTARKLIKQGCEIYPKSEHIWLEAARLHVSDAILLIT